MLLTHVSVSRRVHRNSVHRGLSTEASPLCTPPPFSPFSGVSHLPLSLAPLSPRFSSSSPLVQACSADHFNLHYVRPRIAEGSIKFLLSQAAFSEAAGPSVLRTHAPFIERIICIVQSAADESYLFSVRESRFVEISFQRDLIREAWKYWEILLLRWFNFLSVWFIVIS